MNKAVFTALALTWAGGAFAQGTYPSRPVTMVVGFAPGGGTDTVARILAKTVGEALGQQIVVENKAGAGGNIATDHVAKAAPDGHTLLLGNVGSLTVAPHLVANLPYDPLRDFAPITMAVVFANVVVVPASLPAQTLPEFVKLAREKPGTITYGSSGIGGAGHLAGELLKDAAKIDIVHVPYKGGGRRCRACWADKSTPISRRRPRSSGISRRGESGRSRRPARDARSCCRTCPPSPSRATRGTRR